MMEKLLSKNEPDVIGGLRPYSFTHLETEKTADGLLPEHAVGCEAIVKTISVGGELEVAMVRIENAIDEHQYAFLFKCKSHATLTVRNGILRHFRCSNVDIEMSGSSFRITPGKS